jgi:hypothetical protein
VKELSFNDLLQKDNLKPAMVLLMRHRPRERLFAEVLRGLRITRPQLFNAYQSWQIPRFYASFQGISYLASFVEDDRGRALFCGLWEVRARRLAGYDEWRADARNTELVELGMDDWNDAYRGNLTNLDLAESPILSGLIGHLLVEWITRGQSWSHRSDRHDLPILAIHEENHLDLVSKPWYEIDLSWSELATLPPNKRLQLAEWRGIYLIFDKSDGKSYVGSASGNSNLLGRWLDYAARSDGGNHLLRGRDPTNFRFSILQRVSPDMPPGEVQHIEATWKQRLHTRTHGLNAN